LPSPTFPTGTITFLATDIEGSTSLWEKEPLTMRAELAAHDATLRGAVLEAGGVVFKHTGDGALAAFATPQAALAAAIRAQRALRLPVRMGLCSGEAELRDDDYFGLALNRATRAMAAAHGGQVLLAAATASLLDAGTLPDASLIDLGEHRLRGLSESQRLFQVKAAGLRETFPPLNASIVGAGNLPMPANALLGRATELAAIARLLPEVRLVTLTGVGGVGKTRLALAAASDAAVHQPDGVWLCELAAVTQPDAVAHAVAALLGVTQLPDRALAESLAEALADRQMLLVLDNCEHVIDAVANLLRLVLPRCRRLKVLATSREALSIDGERQLAVAPLALGEDKTSPAVALFAERAQAVSAGFDLERDREPVVEICRRLDGIPLAIELAAARVRALAPRQIRDRLDERFRLLGGTRSLGRHQTLAQAIQWSYDLLSEAERRVLERASVFAGGFDLEAAEAVCAGDGLAADEVLDLVDSLARKSLLTVDTGGEAARYGMLETIRQFATEKALAVLEVSRERHALWFADESDRRFLQWRSPRESETYPWLEREIDNLRVAFRWALERNQIDPAARIASNVGDVARFMLREEAANWAAEVVDAARGARHPRLIVLLTWASSSAWAFQDLAKARQFATEAIGLLSNAAFDAFAWAYADLAMVAAFEGNATEAIEVVRAGALHPIDRRDRFCSAILPWILVLAGRYEEARGVADQSVSLARAAGMPSAIGFACFAKGLAHAPSDPPVALLAFQEGLEISRRAGNRLIEGLIGIELANLQATSSDPRRALESFRELLAVSTGVRDTLYMSNGVGALIRLFVRLKRFEAALVLYCALPKSIERGIYYEQLKQAVAEAEAALGLAAVDSAQARGASMPPHYSYDFARREIETALVEL
jgi:predicted ATPase